MNSSIIKHREILPIYVKGLYNHKYTLKQASESTGYSIVHLCRLRKKYEQYGAQIFEHGNSGHIPTNKIDTKLRQRIACIYSLLCFFGLRKRFFQRVFADRKELRGAGAHGFSAYIARKGGERVFDQIPVVRKPCKRRLRRVLCLRKAQHAQGARAHLGKPAGKRMFHSQAPKNSFP